MVIQFEKKCAHSVLENTPRRGRPLLGRASVCSVQNRPESRPESSLTIQSPEDRGKLLRKLIVAWRRFVRLFNSRRHHLNYYGAKELAGSFRTVRRNTLTI